MDDKKKGKTSMLTANEARALLESIDTATSRGLRDWALIALMTYAFARVGLRREKCASRGACGCACLNNRGLNN